MKNSLFFIFLFSTLFCKGQFVELSSKAYDLTLNSTVLVVLKYSDSLNARISNAFKKYWTATPFKLVTEKYPDTLKVGKGKPLFSVFEGSLAKTVRVTTSNTGQQKEKGTFANWWSYFLVPLDKEKKPDGELITAWGPINLLYYEWDQTRPYENTIYRIDFIVKQVNDVLEFIRQNRKGDVKDFEQMINRKTSALKNKILLVPQELLQEYDIWKVTHEQMEAGVGKVYTSKKPIYKKLVTKEDLESYAGRYKVLSYNEIDKLANSPEAGQYALFSPLVNDRKYIFVFDLASREIIYTDKAMMSMEVNKKDIKQLNQQAGF